MTTEDMIRNLKRVVALYKDKPVYTGEINISCMCQDVINHLRELNEKTKWHTEMPTEEGWYLVKYKCIYKGKYFGKIEYHTMQITKDEFSHKLDIRGHASDDVWKAIEWQKIEEKTE